MSSLVVAACFSSSSNPPPRQDAGGDGLTGEPDGASLPGMDATTDTTLPVESGTPDVHSGTAPEAAGSDDAAEDSAPVQGSTDAPVDTGVTCGSITCGMTTASSDGGSFYNSCSAVCLNVSPTCTCSDNFPEACFCGIGNSAPACLAGSLSDCGYVPTCSAALDTDPQNCGRCGHSCQGLTCTGGICTPPQLSFGPPFYPSDWTSDGTYIYASDCSGAGTVIRVPAASGVPTSGSPLTYTTGNGPWGIAIDATTIYWLQDSGGTVWSAPIDGSGSPTLLGTYGQSWFSTCGSPHSIATDANNLYWAVQPSSGFGYVYSLPKGGGQVQILAHDAFVLRGTVAVDANNVYFLAWNGPDGQLRSVSKSIISDAGTPSTLLTTFPNDQVADMRLVGSTFYVGGSSTSIYDVPLAGGTPAIFWAGHIGLSPRHLDTDGTTLFFTDFIDSVVYEKPLAGGYAQRIAVNQLEPDFILVDANSVYWTSNYGGYSSVPRTYRP